MRILELINDYWPALLAIGGALDVVSGYLPPKYAAYIGITRRIVRRVAGKEPAYLTKPYVKKGSGTGVVSIAILLILSACATAPTADPVCDRDGFQDSLICKWVHEAGDRSVEDVRDLLLTANDISIVTESYTVEQLAAMLSKWEERVQASGVTYALFFSGVVDDLEKARAVASILQRRFTGLQSADVVRMSDRELILIMIDRTRQASGIPIPDGVIGSG